MSLSPHPLVLLAGLGQLALAAGSLAIPRPLGWRGMWRSSARYLAIAYGAVAPGAR